MMGHPILHNRLNTKHIVLKVLYLSHWINNFGF